MIRASILFVVAGLLCAGVLYDRVDAPEVAATEIRAETIVTPSMREPARLDGAWFCPAGSSTPGGYADHSIELSNLGDEPAKANVVILGATGKLTSFEVEMPPLSSQSVALSTWVQADLAGAVVEIVGGVGAVGHTVQTAQGPAQGACATHVTNTWYFASGRTSLDAEEYLTVMNPFPEDAVFNIEFYRAVGRPRQDADLKDTVVPGNSVLMIPIHDFAQREDSVAMSIVTTRGRLVAERLQLANGFLGPKGAALQLGVPTPAESWMLPAGRIHDGGGDQVIVFNPSSVDTAKVEIELWPINPTDRSLYGLGTIPRELLPGRFEIIDLRSEANRFGLPLPYEVGISVSSTNGTPVVAERWHFATDVNASAEAAAATEAPAEGEQAPAEGEEAPAVGDAVEVPADETGELDVPGILGGEAQVLTQPSPDVGISTSHGSQVLAERWVFPWVSTPAADSSVIVVTSPEDASVEVSAVVNGAVEGPYRATVPAGGRAVISLPLSSGGAAVLVEADRPVSAEAQVVVLGSSFATIAGAPTIAG